MPPRFAKPETRPRELDARVLVGHALGLDHAALVSNGKRVLNDTEADRVTNAARRRLAGQPVSRIIGKREFWGMPFVRQLLWCSIRAPTPKPSWSSRSTLIDRDGPRTRR